MASYETDYLHRHGWRIAGSEMHDCRKVPLWKKTGLGGMFTTTQAYEHQRGVSGFTRRKGGEPETNQQIRRIAPKTV